jgi:hypothetical protein
MIIDHIKTDLFSIGTFGRSGSRTIADFLSKYYSDYISEAVRIRFLYDFHELDFSEKQIILTSFREDKVLKQMVSDGFVPHHYYSMNDTEDYNNYKNKKTPKILVLRDPLERAKSGATVKLEQAFHGMPTLFSIDFDSVDYVIDFNRINDYTNGLKLGDASDIKLTIDILKNTSDSEMYNFETMLIDWDPSDYDYEKDNEIYNDALETKEHLPVDLWKSLVRNIVEINLPTKIDNIRYKKKWDM